MCRKNKTIVVGLGNTILSDDGVGIYIARKLAKDIHDHDMVFQEASMGGLELIDMIADYHKVVLIDSIISDTKSPGSIIELKIDSIKGGSAWTRHQVSLKEAIALAKKCNIYITDDIKIYGIVVKDISTFSEECTPEVKASLPEIIESLKNTLVSNQ